MWKGSDSYKTKKKDSKGMAVAVKNAYYLKLVIIKKLL